MRRARFTLHPRSAAAILHPPSAAAPLQPRSAAAPLHRRPVAAILLAALLPLLATACGPEPADTAKTNAAIAAALDAGTAVADPNLSPPAAGDGHVRKVKAKADVKLEGDRVDAKPGDWLLENERTVVVVSQKGVIVDLGPRGGIDAMVGNEPTVFASLGTERLEPPTFDVAQGGAVLHERRLFHGKQGRYDAFFSLRGDVLLVDSLVTSTGDDPLLSESLGDTIGWGNVPTWIEGVGFADTTGANPTAFVGRESLGLAYAMESSRATQSKTTANMMARVASLESNGFWDAPYLSEAPVIVEPRGTSPRRSVAIAWSRTSLGDAALLLPRFSGLSRHVVPLPALPPGTFVEVARCEPDLPAALRSDALLNQVGAQPAPADGGVEKLAPRFEHLVTRFAYAPDRKEIRIPEGCHGVRLTALGHSTGKWVLADELADQKLEDILPKAGSVHIKIAERGKEGPMPGRVLFHGRRGTPNPWWGDDPSEGAALDTLYSEGETTLSIPPGHYTARVHRGFEFTAEERDFDVEADEKIDLSFELERVVDTAGWIAADLHVHAAPSPDAPSPLRDRVRSLAASGVEVAVATDHNRVTDYGPSIRDLHLEAFIAGVIGDELTTKDPYFGHFNSFPLRPDAPPVPWEHTTPAAMFAAARASGVLGIVPLVQANHPRMGGIGYFDLMRFDAADVAGWQARTNFATLDFDAIEVFNGDHYAIISKVEESMKDWYALLKAGFRPTATGNSDSHKLTFAEAGVPRNMVRITNDDPAKLDQKEFIASIKAGHVVVVSGPFIRFTANDKGIGEDVPEGDLDLSIRVDAAPWVDVDRVDLVIDGEVAQTFRIPSSTAPVRFEQHVTRRLNRGDFVLVVARGSKPMTYLHRGGAKPFSFTNPIFVR